jgi:hypothetical protein
MLSYTYYKYNLKPTYTISIYYKNERGQIPEKGFSLIEKLYYNVFEIMSSFDNSRNSYDHHLVIRYYVITKKSYH